MTECRRQASDDVESAALPEPHRPLVGADHEVELHGPEPSRGGGGERMLTHQAGDTAARRPGRGHVSAIGHMRTAASLVRAQVVGPDDVAVLFGHEDLM